MRPIRFRAWDKLRVEMVYERWAIKFKPEVKFVSGIMLEPDETPNCERIYGEWNDTESIIVMQFTGLHDKNGKEICEADVIKYDDGSIDVVEWDKESTGFYPFLSLHWDSDWVYPKDVEVVGNIYENPELLEVMKNEG